MPLRLKCPHCGKIFSAWDTLGGSVVQCPNCEQSMRVPGPTRHADADVAAPPDEIDEQDDEELKFAPEEPLADTAADESEGLECPNCGVPLGPDGLLCDNCGYHRTLKRSLETDVETYVPNRETGFRRWYLSQLEEGESHGSVMLWVWILITFVLLLLATVFWPPWSYLVIGCLLAAYLIYRGIQYGRAKDESQPSDSEVLQARLWYLLLLLLRVWSWREPSYPFRKRPTLDVRNSSFGDQDLAELADDEELEVLDLQGTEVTDQGLVWLRGLKQLKYIVLCHTGVSDEGVQQLQKSIPRAWIWH